MAVKLPGRNAPDGSMYVSLSDGVGTAFAADGSQPITITDGLTGNTTTVGSGREKISAARTYYVRTDGSNSNTGLEDTAGGAFLTIQKAVDVVAGLDMNMQNVTIQVRAGTYNESVWLKPYTGGGFVTLVGDIVTPGNVIINGGASGAALLTAGPTPCRWTCNGFRLLSNTTGLSVTGAGCEVLFTALSFNVCGVSHINVSSQCAVIATGAYFISGASPIHVSSINGGYMNGVARTVTITGTPAFSTAFAVVQRASTYDCRSATFSGSATGKRYDVTLNSVLDSGGLTLPGDVAGTTATGGQVT